MTVLFSPEYRANWQIPAFRTDRWLGKSMRFCVVIPVINEGERIYSLLSTMHSLNVHSQVDIIIVDGGSTDGSLGSEMLDSLNVRGLITKTGPGRLSAQLRCAYSFALDMGYDGVITIDGNNKDHPSPIPDFVKLLENGMDFIQASRFLVGGVAENTPVSRDLAIRYIHAPVLRWSSGFPWTDTTQGFRGYSSRLLAATELSIFRDVFSSYELLAYLSHRAPKIGFKCVELATTRSYPVGEIPTKISAFRGNLAVLKTLLAAASGRYDVKG